MSKFRIKILLSCIFFLISGIFTIPVLADENPHVKYEVHVENSGWQNPVKDGTSAGTTGSSLRQEAIKVNIVGDNGNPINGLGVSYRSHVQDEGWQGYVSDGSESGTTGQAKKIEAVQIKLTGDKALNFDIFYRTHVENFGWTNWTANGSPSGSEGFNYRLEAIEIRILPVNSSEAPESNNEIESFYTNYGKGNVRYEGHVENIGWQNYVDDGEDAGTTGQNLKLEALRVNLNPELPEGEILISPHVQDVGWMDYVPSYGLVGTTGQNKRLEAVKIKLTGKLAEAYDVYYQAHVQDIGWQDSVKNDQEAGSTGKGLKIEALNITLLPKEKDSSYSVYTKGASTILNKYPIPDNPDLENPFSSKRLLIQATINNTINLRDYKAIDNVNGENGLMIAQFRTEDDTINAFKKLCRNEDVISISPDEYMTLDIQKINQVNYLNQNEVKALANTQTMSWGANKTGLTDLAASIKTDNKVSVAVIDTGINTNDVLTVNKIRNIDGNDIINGDNSPVDNSGHGTHVSGTIIDCMPDLNVEIMPLKVSNNGTMTELSVQTGILKAIENKADVINMSLGFKTKNNFDVGSFKIPTGYNNNHYLLDKAINLAIKKNITVCVSSGNDNSSCDVKCPAHIPGVITVGAVNKNNIRADFSNFGNSLDITAPGVGIKSCVPNIYDNSGFAEMDGTSMACPHVSAAAAMLKLQDSSRSPSQIKDLLYQSALDVGSPGWDQEYGAGVLDVHSLAKEPGPNTGVDNPDNPSNSGEKELILECPDTIEMHVGETIEIPVTLLPNNSGFNGTVKDFNGGGVDGPYEEEWKKYIDYNWIGGDIPTNEYFDVDFVNLNSGEQNAYVRIHSKKQYYLGVPSVGNKFEFWLRAFYFDGKYLDQANDQVTIISLK